MNFILRKTRFTFLRMSKMERIRERIKGKGKEREEVIIMIMILSNKGGKKMDDKSPWCLDRIKGEARFARKKLYHVVRRRPSQPYCAAKRLGCRRLCSSQPPLSLFCRGNCWKGAQSPSFITAECNSSPPPFPLDFPKFIEVYEDWLVNWRPHWTSPKFCIKLREKEYFKLKYSKYFSNVV